MDDTSSVEEMIGTPSAENVNDTRVTEEMIGIKNYEEYEDEMDTSDEEVHILPSTIFIQNCFNTV